MALPTSKNELIDYCLRQLGSPVINVELTDDQNSDAVDYALQKFIPKHYDGSEETFLIHILKKDDLENGYVSLPNEITSVLDILDKPSGSSIEPFDSVMYYTMWDYVYGYGRANGTMSDYYITQQHLSLVNFLMNKSNTFVYNSITKRLSFTSTQTYIGSSTLFDTNLIEDAKWVKTNATVVDNQVAITDGDLKATEITSVGAGVFGISYNKETDKYVRGTYSAEVILQAGTYTGSVDIIIEDRDANLVATKTVALSTTWEKFDLSGEFVDPNVNDINIRFETTTAAAGAGETFHVWAPSSYMNNFIAIRGYKGIDSDEFDNLWSTEWLLKYVTQLMKRTWGTNLKKFSGVQLPGGIEMNGQTIYDEAVGELEKLDEQFESEYSLPVDFFMA